MGEMKPVGVQYMDLGKSTGVFDFLFMLTLWIWSGLTLHRAFLFSILVTGWFYNFVLLCTYCCNLDLYLHSKTWPQLFHVAFFYLSSQKTLITVILFANLLLTWFLAWILFTHSTVSGYWNVWYNVKGNSAPWFPQLSTFFLGVRLDINNVKQECFSSPSISDQSV